MLGRLPRGNLILAAIVVAQLGLLATGPSAAAFDEQRVTEEFCATRVEVLGTDRCIPFTAGPEYLRENYDGGRILISARLDWLIYESGLPIKELIHEGNRNLWREALQDPSTYARWIVMSGTQPGLTADAVFDALYGSPVVAQNYRKTFDSRGLTIYRRIDQVWPPSAVSGGSP